MALIRQEDKRTGITYAYEAKARWDPEKRQSRYGKRVLIGHLDPETGEIIPSRPAKPSAATPSAKREFCGTCELLSHVAGESGVAKALMGSCHADADKVLSLAQYLICEGTAPLSRYPRYALTHATPFGKPIASQRSNELLASLGEPQRDSFCTALAAIHVEGDRLFYGTTSISSYPEALSQVKWGRSKDRAPLPRINLAMLAGQDSGIPLYYRKVAGSIADVSAAKTLVKDMDPAFPGKIGLVMDRGFWSGANVSAMMRERAKLLLGMPAHLALFRRMAAERASDLRTWTNYDTDSKVYGMRIPHERDCGEARPRRGGVVRAERRGCAYLFFDTFPKRGGGGRLAGLPRELPAEPGAGNRIEAHEAYYDRYLGKARGRWAGKGDAIASACSMAGCFALLSNEAMEPSDALALYRDKGSIEEGFGDAENLLDFREPRVSADQALEGKLLVLFVALVLTAWLRRRMRETGLDEDYTLAGLLDEVETIERYSKTGSRPRILEVTSRQKAIFEKLGYEAPATS